MPQNARKVYEKHAKNVGRTREKCGKVCSNQDGDHQTIKSRGKSENDDESAISFPI
jgi:hypothetical protein